jgi:signal transduction histidine kinase
MAVMSLVVILIVASTTSRHIDSSLKDRIAATKTALRSTSGGGLRLDHKGKNTIIDSVWVFDHDGKLISGPEAGEDIEATVRGMAHVREPTRLNRDQRAYYATPIRLHEHTAQPVGVAVATLDVDPYNDARDRLITGLIVLGVAMTVLTATFSAWTVRRTLKPVEQMTNLANLWSEHDLDTRFHLEGSDDELTRLGTTLDRLLDQVAAAIRAEQQLTSELAHELRTPLTTIRAEAELGLVAAREPDARGRLQRVVAQVDRLTGTISTLLEIARHQHGRSHGCDVETVLDSLVEAHSETLPITLHIEESACGAQAAADAHLLERVVSPILDNAVRYAASRAWITIRRQGQNIVVEVCDDGGGIHTTAGIFQTNVADMAGTGLGLPLAQRVVTGLGGKIRVAQQRDPTIVQITVPTR